MLRTAVLKDKQFNQQLIFYYKLTGTSFLKVLCVGLVIVVVLATVVVVVVVVTRVLGCPGCGALSPIGGWAWD